MRARAAVGGILTAAILAGEAVSCSSDRFPAAPEAATPRLDVGSAASVTGRILGPDGASICNSLYLNANRWAFVSIYRASDYAWITSPGSIPCPKDSYSVSLPPGVYLIGVTLSDTKTATMVPRYYEDTLTVGAEAVIHDIAIPEGTRLLGGAAVDGEPIGGLAFNFNVNPTGYMGAWFGESYGTPGSWEFMGIPIFLQNGITLRFSPCYALGAAFVRMSPSGAFVFPTESDRVDCILRSSEASRFTHSGTRLVLTVGPGGLGYSNPSSEEERAYGYGWGLQYPVGASTKPSRLVNEQSMWVGGLVIRLASGALFGPQGRLLSWDSRNILLPPQGKLAITDLGSAGKEMLWQYDDDGIPGAPGLAISQKSWDGHGGDYVTVQYRIRNRSADQIEIAPGFFMDFWSHALGTSAGSMALEGRLTYAYVDGRYLGTFLLGSPPAPTGYFLSGASSEEIGAALQAPAQPPAGGSAPPIAGSFPYVQGLGLVTLKRGQKVDLSLAIIGAQTLTELLASAAAADADYAARQ